MMNANYTNLCNCIIFYRDNSECTYRNNNLKKQIFRVLSKYYRNIYIYIGIIGRGVRSFIRSGIFGFSGVRVFSNGFYFFEFKLKNVKTFQG